MLIIWLLPKLLFKVIEPLLVIAAIALLLFFVFPEIWDAIVGCMKYYIATHFLPESIANYVGGSC